MFSEGFRAGFHAGFLDFYRDFMLISRKAYEISTVSDPSEKSHWERQFCPLSGIQKRPFLGGWFCTKAVVISIRATDFVRCREVVLLSEGPLWEVRLYPHGNKHAAHIYQ